MRYGTDDSVNWSDYTEDTFRTVGDIETERDLILMSTMGLAGETGEVIDLLKKHVWQKHTLDRAKLTEEIGDIFWYLAVLMESCDVSLAEALAVNHAKLMRRYPDGFETERSLNRED